MASLENHLQWQIIFLEWSITKILEVWNPNGTVGKKLGITI
jgi:hypothetical protein